MLGVVASVCTSTTTPNIVGVTMSGVVASVYMQPNVEKGKALQLPKSTSVNVEPCIRCSVRARCQHFSVYLLRCRLNLAVSTYHL